MACDLTCWTRCCRWTASFGWPSPRRCATRLWHTAARISRHARRLIVRLQRTWPWAHTLAAAFIRLRALPLRC